MIVELLTLGDELLDGRRVDTNTAWLGRRFTTLGSPPRYRQTTTDDIGDIVQAFQLALSRSDFIVCTGGLGPTADDLTFEALAQAVQKKLVFHPAIYEKIKKRFEERGLRCPESNRRQAMLPEGSVEIPTDWGTAPGLRLEVGEKIVFCLPGVPMEMMNLFDRGVAAEFEKRMNVAGQRVERIYKFAGISESALEEEIEKCGLRQISGGEIRIAYTASFPQIDVTLSVLADQNKNAGDLLSQADRLIEGHLKTYWIGTNDETLESLIFEELLKRNWRLTVAESMTGGLISGQLMSISGMSKVFESGFITYSNKSKQELLFVHEKTLQEFGAVSKECALEMALGAVKRSGAQVGIAVTGIAGPTGETKEKPVGLTFISWVGPDFEEVQQYQFRWDRNRNRMLAVHEAFMGLFRVLKKG